MPIYSHGYTVKKLDQDSRQAEWQLFCQNVPLLLNNRDIVLRCSSYFFCAPAFAYCSWAYLPGDGALCLGFLLMGWTNGILTQKCPDSNCRGVTLITSFGGSHSSGSNSWSGYCQRCLRKMVGSRTDVRFIELIEFVSKLRQRFPDSVAEWEEYDGFQFMWGGDARQPVIKKRLVSKALFSPVNLETLIQELSSGHFRSGDAFGNISLLTGEHKLKLSNKSGAQLLV